MPGFPLVIDLTGVGCRVIGAGLVAERKARALLRAGARVMVIAPRSTCGIAALARRRRLIWRRSDYRTACLQGARLVVAATSDSRVNQSIARDAKRLGVFCNVADDPAGGSAIWPAILRRGPVLLAVSTGGESPAFARQLRDELRQRYGPEYGAYVRLLGSIRRHLRRTIDNRAERMRRYRRVLRTPLLRLLRNGRSAEARRIARAAAGLA